MNNNEAKIINWLQSKINQRIFLDGFIFEVNENSDVAKANIIDLFSNKKDIQIYFDDGINDYNYKVIISPIDDKIKDLVYLNAEIPIENSSEYTIGRTEKNIKIWKDVISNNLFTVPDFIKKGIDLLEILDENLTPEQIIDKNKIKNWIYKLNARNRINAEIGDVYDQLANTDRRIGMLERLCLRMFKAILNNESLPPEHLERYTAFCNGYVDMVDAGYYVDRADLENEQELFASLTQKFGKITNIVKEEYFDKKIE